jgi:predicted AlkP superfamily phosphohydrolase/phosphomutase
VKPPSLWVGLALTVFALLLLVALDVAVQRSGGSSVAGKTYKVMLLGLDGADPDFIEPMVAAGKLPNFARLLREGAYGRCQTFKPTKSVVVWTSIATGKRMEKHGVIDWMVLSPDGQEKVPATGHVRRTEALWNMASAADRRVQVVNWWATWPAEPVRGEMVSNHFRKALRRRVEETTYPAALYDELAPLARQDVEDVRREMKESGILLFTPEAAEAAFRPSPTFRANFRESVNLFGEDRLFEEVSRHLLRTRGQPDLFAAIFRNLDIFSHFAWRFIDRRTAERVFGELNRTRKPLSAAIEKQMDDAYAAVLAPVYEHEDRRLGRFLDEAGPDTVVVVVSDHGFQFRNDPRDVERRYGFYHYDGPVAPSGVLFLWGPPIRPGFRLQGASVFDICPTVLYLLGLPVGRDMDGRVLVESIDSKLLGARPVSWIRSHDTGRRGSGARPSPIDQEILEELRALGYVQ